MGGSQWPVSYIINLKRHLTTIVILIELEALRGHSVVPCTSDGTLNHGSAEAGEDVLNTNLTETFETHLQCKL